jgi:AcrR family transcriptional regulator
MTDPQATQPDDPAATWQAAGGTFADRHDTRRLSLIQAAGRAFGRKGFHRTTLDEIAAELGVTKPILYRYVSSKQEILYECHRLAVGMAEQALVHAAAQGGSALSQIAAFTRDYIARTTTALGTCVVLAEHSSMTPEDAARIQQRRRRVDAQLRALVARAVQDGEIAPCDPKLAVFFFMGAINGISRWFAEGGERSGHQIAAAYADFIVNSLSPRRLLPPRP